MEYQEIDVDKGLEVLETRNPWFQNKYVLDIYENGEISLYYMQDTISLFAKLEKLGIESKPVIIKKNIDKIMEKDLRKIQEPDIIGIGTRFNEAYQPCEKKYGLVRKCLEFIKLHKFPLHIITRNTLIERDIDLLKEISENNWCYVTIAITTMEPKLSKILEPHFPNPMLRIHTLKKLAESGINCGVAIFPIFPYITDDEKNLNEIYKFSKGNGAKYILDIPLRLPDNQKEDFYAYMLENPKIKKFIKRYQRLYQTRNVPYGKVMQKLNRLCFDVSKKYEMPRSIPPSEFMKADEVLEDDT